MKKSHILEIVILVLLSAFAAGCGTKQTEQPTETAVVFMPTRVAGTEEFIPTETTCENVMSFLGETNVADGSEIAAGSVFIKTWEIQNVGTCDWGDGYLLRFISGEQMTNADYFTIPRIGAGEKGKFSIEFTAPTEPGTYRSEWILFGADNRFFGPKLYVEFVVK